MADAAWSECGWITFVTEDAEPVGPPAVESVVVSRPRRRWIAAWVAVTLLAGCAAGTVGVVWLRPGPDPREYEVDSAVTVQLGDGSLEEDILPHYELALPCSTANVRYFDDESLVGSEGELFLNFSAPQRCLALWLDRLRLTAGLQRLTGKDPLFPYEARQDRFGWRFDTSKVYDVYQGDISERNSATVVVDNGGSAPIIYVIVEHP